MAELTEPKASIRFYGETLDPDNITRTLGKLPTGSVRKDDTISNSNRRVTTGSWILSAPMHKPANLDAQIERLL